MFGAIMKKRKKTLKNVFDKYQVGFRQIFKAPLASFWDADGLMQTRFEAYIISRYQIPFTETKELRLMVVKYFGTSAWDFVAEMLAEAENAQK